MYKTACMFFRELFALKPREQQGKGGRCGHIQIEAVALFKETEKRRVMSFLLPIPSFFRAGLREP